MSADYPAVIQYKGEVRRHIFDFAPALIADESIATAGVHPCVITAELGPATMVCTASTEHDDNQVHLTLQSPDSGRYLVEQRITTDPPQGASSQTLISRLRVTVL